jgi:hypothetical protein
MTDEEQKAWWAAASHTITDRMKVFTRPYVTILAGGDGDKPPEIGTGTFIEKSGIRLLTCEHVAKFKPSAYYIDGNGSTKLDPGTWCVEPDPAMDVAFAPMSTAEWGRISGSAQPLPMSKFAQRHHPAERELLFFRGIGGENAYVSGFGAHAILTGYCSQEKLGTGDGNIFEVLWKPGETTVTSGTDSEVRARFKHDNPGGFSGSLVWNTRFVELGCDFSTWSPEEAVVTGLLRRWDKDTCTLLVWRVEHLLGWL